MTHGLTTHRSTSAFLTGLQGRSNGHRVPSPAGLVAEVVQMRAAVPGPVRDGASRVGALASMDTGNRVCIAKAAAAAGWSDGSPIVVTCELGGRVLARPGLRAKPTEHASSFQGGRLTLPATARACLAVSAGDQVIVTSVPGGDSILIVAAVDVLQHLTGPSALPEPTASAQPVRRRSSVRAAWSDDCAGVR